MMAATLSANAQFEPGTISVQPRLGATISWLSNMPKLDLNEHSSIGRNTTLDKAPTVGAIIGADMEFQLSRMFSLSAGVNWAMAGSGWDDYKYKNGSTEIDVKDIKVETSYVNVPVTANIYLFKGFAVKAGVQFGFLTSANSKMTTEAKDGSTNLKTEIDEDVKDEFEKFDIAIPVGVSYQFKVPVVIDLRYNIGLNKVNKESLDGFKDSRNNVFALTVGYKFAL